MIRENVEKFYDLLGHSNSTYMRLIDPNFKLPMLKRVVRTKEEFVKVCEQYDSKYNIYTGLNSRSDNEKGTMGKEAVCEFNCVGIDLDTIRPDSKQPSTQQELEMCRDFALNMADELEKNNYEVSAVAMSGNGYWILLSLDSPLKIDSEYKRVLIDANIKKFGNAIKQKFDEEATKHNVEIDASVFELARISKVVGTKSIKGDDTEDRPHRFSSFQKFYGRRTNTRLRIKLTNTETPVKIYSNENKTYVLPKPLRNFIFKKFPNQITSGSRHYSFAKIFGHLSEEGYARQQIEHTLLWFNAIRCSPSKTDESVRVELEGLINQYGLKSEDTEAWNKGKELIKSIISKRKKKKATIKDFEQYKQWGIVKPNIDYS